MMIPIKTQAGLEQAQVTCDGCRDTQAVVAAAHGDTRNEKSKGVWSVRLLNEGQAMAKLQKQGWALIRGKHFCPKCVADRRGKREDGTMQQKADTTRKPSLEQRRLIIEMLVIAYDGAANRYRGNDTDKTIADALGGGIMPGWVAEIREQNFGPAGGNEEIDAIRAEIAAIRADAAARCDALTKRIDAVCAAVGPRAARA